MEHIAFLNELKRKNKFNEIFEDKVLYQEFVEMLNVITNTNKLAHISLTYFMEQNDVLRYANLVKKVASIDTLKFGYDIRLTDSSINPDKVKETMIEDTQDFFKVLDNLTVNKFELYSKVDELIPYVDFGKNVERAIVSVLKDNNIPYIGVNTEPYIFNRTSLAHELWHALSSVNIKKEKNNKYNRVEFPNEIRKNNMVASMIAKGKNKHNIIKPDIDEYYFDFFIDEIGSMFIEKLAQCFIIAKYENDEVLSKNFNFFNVIMHNEFIRKAQLSYIDHLVCLGSVGSEREIRQYANNQIVENSDKIWGISEFYNRIADIYDYVQGNGEYFPVREFAYIIGEIIADIMCDKFIEGLNHKNVKIGKKIMIDVMSKMLTINENISSIYKLKQENSTLNNQLDIITDYLELDRIEVLIDEYIIKVEDIFKVANIIYKDNL